MFRIVANYNKWTRWLANPTQKYSAKQNAIRLITRLRTGALGKLSSQTMKGVSANQRDVSQ